MPHRPAELFVERGPPDFIRSGNGTEFAVTAVRRRLEQVGVKTLFIAPGNPWENGCTESFIGRLRDEPLARAWAGKGKKGEAASAITS